MVKKVALLAVASAVSFAGVAQGAQTPFTITDTINFGTGARAFTATGPLCASGTYADDIVADRPFPHSNGAIVVIRTVFTCADGSGTFNGLKRFRVAFVNDTSFTFTGRLKLKGGTGAYTRMRGHGNVVGAAVNDVGGGFTTGVLR